MDIEYPVLYQRARDMCAVFADGQPFRHVVIDDFFDSETYRRAREAFPPSDSPIWKKPENVHTKGKFVTKRGAADLKETMYDEDARRLLLELNSGLFLRFLVLLTGIGDLMPDPYFAESGFHRSESGGFLDIHADFSHNDLLGLERRINLILYLNEDWKPEYGGALSLYDPGLKPVRSILPIANRCVIFETSETSYHGHPEPMDLPENVYRKSIALYYYTIPRQHRAKSGIVFPTDRGFAVTPTRE